MAEKANRIVTVSYAMREHLASIGYPPDNIAVCWNGCGPEKYDPAKVRSESVEALKSEYGIHSNEKVVLFVRAVHWKSLTGPSKIFTLFGIQLYLCYF